VVSLTIGVDVNSFGVRHSEIFFVLSFGRIVSRDGVLIVLLSMPVPQLRETNNILRADINGFTSFMCKVPRILLLFTLEVICHQVSIFLVLAVQRMSKGVRGIDHTVFDVVKHLNIAITIVRGVRLESLTQGSPKHVFAASWMFWVTKWSKRVNRLTFLLSTHGMRHSRSVARLNSSVRWIREVVDVVNEIRRLMETLVLHFL